MITLSVDADISGETDLLGMEDLDGILIARIESTSQSIRFVGMKAGKITAVKTLSLSDVTLTPETPTVDLAEADTNDDGTYSEAELKALTKAQLLELADALLVEGVSSSNTKAEIIAAILAAQENQGG